MPQATRWLELCGCHRIFYISSYTGQGLSDIMDYLREPGDAPAQLQTTSPEDSASRNTPKGQERHA